MNRLYYILFFILSFTILQSCGIHSRLFEVDIKGLPDKGLENFNATDNEYLILAVNNTKRESDSLLLSAFTFGLADILETEFDKKRGSIPVVYTDQFDYSDPESGLIDSKIKYDPDYIILIDSLDMSHKITAKTDTYSDTHQLVNLTIPVSIRSSLYNMDLFVLEYNKLDTTVLSSNIVTNTKNLESINELLNSSEFNFQTTFYELGRYEGKKLITPWQNMKVLLFVKYGSEDWEKAYEQAYSFNWHESIDSWMKIMDSTSSSKDKSYLALNIAMIFSVLKDYEMSMQWIKYADSEYTSTYSEFMKGIINNQMAPQN